MLVQEKYMGNPKLAFPWQDLNIIVVLQQNFHLYEDCHCNGNNYRPKDRCC